MDIETEKASTRQVDSSKKLIADAEAVMAGMSVLRQKLHLNNGCGQRYLQKTHPNQALLEQAEKEIVRQFSGGKGQPQRKSTANESSLLKNLAGRNQV